MGEVRGHVRRPDLPWRQSRMVECGKMTAEVKKVLSRDEALALIARDGIQRASYGLCMTCLNGARQYPDWAQDPIRALSREFFGVTDPAFQDELRAIAALIGAHREEFDTFMTDINDTVDLAERRQQRRRLGRRADGRPR